MLLLAFIFPPSFAAENESCESAKSEFRKLYIAIQNNLNYEKKDAFLEKGKVKLRAHGEKDYGGKLFEEALFHEYQNSLIKVAKVYQNSKKSEDDSLKSNEGLVNFFKAIDNKSPLESDKFDSLLDELKKISAKNNTTEIEKKFIITDNDIYLLKKLLIHAQDKVCTLAKYNGQSKKKAELESVKNAPLNRMLEALQNGKITSKSDLQLVNTESAIKSAVTKQMEDLRLWMKKLSLEHPDCFKAIKNNPDFIQYDIQTCNYKKFVNSLVLDNSSVANLESILHYINANQTHGSDTPMAETGIDKVKLDTFIDQTFISLKDNVSCSEITGDKSKKIFVQNIPSNNNKFDLSKLKCKISDKEVENKECIADIEFTSDELGRGFEARPTDKSKITSFGFAGDSPTCKDEKFLSRAKTSDNLVKSVIAVGNSDPAKSVVPTSELASTKSSAFKLDIPLNSVTSNKPSSSVEIAVPAKSSTLVENSDPKSVTPASGLASTKSSAFKSDIPLNSVTSNKPSSPVEINVPTKSSTTIENSDPKSDIPWSLVTPHKASSSVEITIPAKIPTPVENSVTVEPVAAIEPLAQVKTDIPFSLLAPVNSPNPTEIPASIKAISADAEITPSSKADADVERSKPTKSFAPTVSSSSVTASDPVAQASESKSLGPVKSKTKCNQIECTVKMLTQKEDESIKWSAEDKTCYSTAVGPKGPFLLDKNKRVILFCLSENNGKKEATAASCAANNPHQEFDTEKKECIETKETCSKKNPSQEFDDKKKVCIANPLTDKEAECNKKIEDDVDSEDGRPLNNWSWNSDKKECVEKHGKEKSSDDDEKTSDDKKAPTVYANKPIPGRFTPVMIPTRQAYILPGMP